MTDKKPLGRPAMYGETMSCEVRVRVTEAMQAKVARNGGTAWVRDLIVGKKAKRLKVKLSGSKPVGSADFMRGYKAGVGFAAHAIEAAGGEWFLLTDE